MFLKNIILVFYNHLKNRRFKKPKMPIDIMKRILFRKGKMHKKVIIVLNNFFTYVETIMFNLFIHTMLSFFSVQ